MRQLRKHSGDGLLHFHYDRLWLGPIQRYWNRRKKWKLFASKLKAVRSNAAQAERMSIYIIWVKSIIYNSQRRCHCLGKMVEFILKKACIKLVKSILGPMLSNISIIARSFKIPSKCWDHNRSNWLLIHAETKTTTNLHWVTVDSIENVSNSHSLPRKPIQIRFLGSLSSRFSEIVCFVQKHATPRIKYNQLEQCYIKRRLCTRNQCICFN